MTLRSYGEEGLIWPAYAGGRRLPPAAVLITTLLALAFQWLTARVYTDFIVNQSPDSAVAHTSGGIELPISYTLTAIAAAACALYCQRRAGPSRMIMVIHLAAVVIPMQALVAAHYELARPEFAAAVALSFLGALALAGGMPDVRLPRATRGWRHAVVIAGALLTMYTFGALFARGGLSRLSFDLSTVYQVREQFLEDAAPFIGYLVPWQGYVLDPALMLIGFMRRSALIGLLGLALQLLLFAMTGFRAFLLLPLLLLGLLLIGRRRNLAALVLVGMMAVVGVALALYAWLDAPIVPTLLVDRVIMVPAEIHYWYYDFFGVHSQPPLQLSQSILGALSVSHYNVPIAEVIGWQYMGSAASANVGLFADAFANFGFAGCGIYALLFALLLKLVDAASYETDNRVAIALLGMPAFELVNSGLLTTLSTHGLAVAIVVLWAFGSGPAVGAASVKAS